MANLVLGEPGFTSVQNPGAFDTDCWDEDTDTTTTWSADTDVATDWSADTDTVTVWGRRQPVGCD
jgi:hypothetical protein